jgi:hypothetical protein
MEKLSISVLATGDMGGAITTAIRQQTNHGVLIRGSRPGSRQHLSWLRI